MRKRWWRFGSLALLVAAAGCGGAASGTPSGPSEAGASDAAIDGDGGLDAAPADAGGPPSPGASLLDHCMVARDVFYVDVTGDAPFRGGEWLATNLDSTWRVYTSPTFSVAVDQINGGGRFGIWTPGGGVPPVGVYQQTAQSGFTAPALDLVLGSQGCSVTGGTFALVSWSTSPRPEFSAWFDITCKWDPPVAVRGCIRWEESP